MPALSHRASRLSISRYASGLVLAFGAMAGSAQAAGPAATSPYYGRWTVSETRPVFTARGRLYKMFDVAPCGNDFCGVSVADNGTCGARLFRFLSSHADGTTTLNGHGKWGNVRKNVVIYNYEDVSLAGGRGVELYIGDGYDFGERSENMPKFHAQYRRLGQARCTVR